MIDVMSYSNFDRIGYYLFRKPIYDIGKIFSSPLMPTASKEFIDVIIPVITKDLDILPYCIQGVRRNVLNRIKDIYLVGPPSTQLIEFAKTNNLNFVDENSLFGFGPRDINYVTDSGINRSGWLFQQLIKLSGKIGKCDNYITIDSDHILIKPHVFLTEDNKFVFYRAPEFHFAYYMANKRLINCSKVPLLSYVAHKMIFNKVILADLKQNIENVSNTTWIDAIIASLDKHDLSSFSEFELYASFVEKKRTISKLWFQRAEVRKGAIDFFQLCNSNRKFLSITFPEYLHINTHKH